MNTGNQNYSSLSWWGFGLIKALIAISSVFGQHLTSVNIPLPKKEASYIYL
jgi:hypothetical protein